MEYEEGFLFSFVICRSVKVYSTAFFFLRVGEANVESSNYLSVMKRDFQQSKIKESKFFRKHPEHKCLGPEN